MSSAIGAAFTYLLAQLPAVIQAVDANGIIVDGPVAPALPPPPTPMLFVGATDPQNGVATQGTRNYLELGGRKVNEEFFIPCYIDSSVGDTNQAAARNIALAVYDGVVHLIASDLTLGGALLNGRWAEITDIQMVMTETEAEADDGRRCVITFKVHCLNHYQP